MTSSTFAPVVLNTNSEGKVIYLSESYWTFTGRPAPSATEYSISELGLDDALSIDFEGAIGSALAGRAVFLERKFPRDTQPAVSVTTSIIPYHSDGNIAGAAILIARSADGTQLDLKRRWSAHMDSLIRFGSAVAHEVSNLITIVKGNVELLGDQLPPSLVSHGPFVGAQRGVDRTEHFVEQLLAFARRQQSNPRDVELNDYVSNVARSIRRILPAGIDFRFVTADKPCVSLIEEQALEKTLMTLAMNARASMADTGSIEIKIFARSPREIEACELPLAAGDYAELQIEDDGRVIPQSMLESIFEPLINTKSDGVGARVGLAAVYGFARRSGGFIDVVSGNGKTTFRLYLPLKNEQSQGREPARSAVGLAPRSKLSVLVVDDHEDFASMLVTMLNALGHDARTATSGHDALNALADKHVDLLVTDINLSQGMTGTLLAELYITGNRHGKVLLMSGGEDASFDILQRHPGVCEFVSKPFTRPKLAELLDRLFPV